MQQPVQQVQRRRAVLLRRRQLEGGGQHCVIAQVQGLSRPPGGVAKALGPLPVSLCLGHLDQGQQRGLDAVGPVEQLPLQQGPGLLGPPLLPPQGGQHFPLVPMGVGDLVQQRLRPVQIPPGDAAARHGIGRPLPDFGVRALGGLLVQARDKVLPAGPGCLIGAGEQGQKPLQQPRSAVCQRVAVGELAQLLLCQGKGRAAPIGPGHLVQPVQKLRDLRLRQVLPKGQQCVQVHPQRPGQHRQQGDVRVGVSPFPFVHRRG